MEPLYLKYDIYLVLRQLTAIERISKKPQKRLKVGRYHYAIEGEFNTKFKATETAKQLNFQYKKQVRIVVIGRFYIDIPVLKLGSIAKDDSSWIR